MTQVGHGLDSGWTQVGFGLDPGWAQVGPEFDLGWAWFTREPSVFAIFFLVLHLFLFVNHQCSYAWDPDNVRTKRYIERLRILKQVSRLKTISRTSGIHQCLRVLNAVCAS